MGIENDIQKLFSKVLEEYGGNKSAAAEALGVNNVTFWGWITGKRSLNSVLCELLIKPEEYFSFRAKNHALLLNPAIPSRICGLSTNESKSLKKR